MTVFLRCFRHLFVLAPLMLAGCTDGDAPRRPTQESASAAAAFLVNRIWSRTDAAAPRGAMMVFLADGTLLQDSCRETYRLSQWRREPDGSLFWSEDGMAIRAAVLVLTERELVLRLDLAGGPVEVGMMAAATPYVCPDMPR